MVGTLLDGEGERAADRVRVEEDVAVGEEEPVGLVEREGVAGGEGHGVRFAEPPCGEIGDVENAEAVGVLGGESVHDAAGCVGGAVVNSDDTEWLVGLRQQRGEAGVDGGGLVAGGDDDGQQGLVPCRGRGRVAVVGGVEEVGDSAEAAGDGDGLGGPGSGEEPGGGAEGSAC